MIRDRFAVAAAGVLGVAVLLALLAPVLPLPDPDATDLSARLAGPFSPGHPLGADHLGRDLLSRLVWGLRVSLAVAALATAGAALAGTALGILAGYRGGRLDAVLMRGIDVLLAFPYLLLALAIVAALGPGLTNAVLAIAVVNVPFFARTVRGGTLAEAGRDYVAAARLSGASTPRVLVVEILPNLLPAIVVAVATTFGWMILETAGLSFLGLGAQPPQADLGSMLGDGRKLFLVAPHVAALPGLVILVLVMALNLVADAIRDALDPRLDAAARQRPRPVTAADPAPASPAEAGPLLRVEGLRTWFVGGGREVRAVDGVSFSVARGEALGIVGGSGSGKSVTAASILGLAPSPPARIVGGRIVFDGGDLVGAPPATLRRVRGGRIGMVFQDPGATLDPLFTVGDQLVEAMRCQRSLSRRDARRRAVELLDAVGIAAPARRLSAYPHEMSGGMRQRVGLAIALANDPDLLIADEPTTALDVTTQARILKLLDAERRRRGLAMVFISHDIGVVSQLCDRVLVMRDGRVVEEGTVDAVVNRPRHPYTRQLLDAVPRLDLPA